MAVIKYDKQTFIDSMKPGITTLVMDAFEEKLQEKINGVVQEVYLELKRELPDKIEAVVFSVADYAGFEEKEKIKVIVDLKGDYIGDK